MHFKKYIKQRNTTFQGLRSFKDTLPKNIKKIINKKGYIYSETLSNWKYIVGENLFKICYPKSFKNSKRGHEVDLEYSKKEIIDRMNNFFGNSVVEKLKFISFDNDQNFLTSNKKNKVGSVTINKYQTKINGISNDKIKKSLIELTKVFKEK